MKTYLHKSGARFPEWGCASWFTTSSKGKLQHHIKPGNKLCTNGWKVVKLKDWKEEEIPDLSKPFTDKQFQEYAAKYGVACAQEFLDCCDYSKPRKAMWILNPPKNPWSNEARTWFKKTFGADVESFIEKTSLFFCNTYSFDIISFEAYLSKQFGYNINGQISIKDFIEQKFGKETCEKFAKEIL